MQFQSKSPCTDRGLEGKGRRLSAGLRYLQKYLKLFINFISRDYYNYVYNYILLSLQYIIFY